MRKSKIHFLIILVIILTFNNSCKKLEVENLNEPDTGMVLSTKEDVIKIAVDAFRIWHNASQAYSSPALPMGSMSDQLTCSWGTMGTFDMSSEPRIAWDNSIDYAYSYATTYFWGDSYRALSHVNDVLRVLNAGVVDCGDDTEMLKALSYFIQGLTMGYIALVYDQGIIVDETTDFSSVFYTAPYTEMGTTAVIYLDKAIAICKTNSFIVPEGFVRGMSFTNVELGQLANSFAARILVYNSRTATQNNTVEWTRILNYAQKGIVYDLAPDMDEITWADHYKLYGVYPGWFRIDHRIINLMDNDYPSRWPNDNLSWTTPNGKDPGEASSNDARLVSDFQYLSDNNFKPERGYYHFSHYRCAKWDSWLSTWTGPATSFSVYENDLFIAEAQLRTGNKEAAIASLNASSRSVRGGLTNLSETATDIEVLAAIFYERDVELILTGAGISFYDMRRRDILQRGTILHFPIPGKELELLFMEYYTIEGSPDGVNISNGSWTGGDGLISPPSK